MKIYGADLRKATEEEVAEMIKSFIAAGWELYGGFYHGDNNHHKFIQFIWERDSKPVAPSGYRID